MDATPSFICHIDFFIDAIGGALRKGRRDVRVHDDVLVSASGTLHYVSVLGGTMLEQGALC